MYTSVNMWAMYKDGKRYPDIDGILQKGPYPPCLRMADRALLVGYTLDILVCCAEFYHSNLGFIAIEVNGLVQNCSISIALQWRYCSLALSHWRNLSKSEFKTLGPDQNDHHIADKILIYRKLSNTRHTKSQNLYVYHFVLQLPLCNLLKPGVQSRMKM